ncbi:Uncharacterised protein [Achromobacter ruhlandii]|nr:Uncharacterised protein [Achromobacter ruhlandii]CUK15304.1 Uncharacterised protein [Achromobacter ruhlandii]
MISQISAICRPETKPRSSVATSRMPVRSDRRREPSLAAALGARSTGWSSTSNQKAVTASLASVM